MKQGEVRGKESNKYGNLVPTDEDPAEHEHMHELKNKHKTSMLSMAIKEKVIKAGSGWPRVPQRADNRISLRT